VELWQEEREMGEGVLQGIEWEWSVDFGLG